MMQWARGTHSAALLVLTLAWSAAIPHSSRATTVTVDEMARARKWMALRYAGVDESGNPELPFSFTYGGKASVELLKGWRARRNVRKLDERRTEHTLMYKDPESGVVLRCVAVEYHDFPVLEWTLYFQNTGRDDTAILENIRCLDAAWQRSADGEFLLHHAVGSPANGSDYGPLQTPLGPNGVKRIAAAGGRPTNSDLSYFNLQWGGRGVIIVVGWPGQWAAEFVRDQQRTVRVLAGQEQTHFKLLPGEEVRTPLMVLLFWNGDRIRAHNLWRRWMMAHSMPRPGGKLPPPQFVASSSRAYREMIGANESNQIMHIDRYLEEGLKIDYWWMDAGWYIQQQGWPQVGTWEVDPARFPAGFKPISDHAHSRGVKILVWFEPERVAPGTWLYQNRREWLLPAPLDPSHPLAGLRSWSARELGGTDPCVTYNPTSRVRTIANIRWEPGRLAFHPGPKGEYSVVRFTAPEGGEHSLRAAFLAIDRDTTTSVHVVHGGRSLFEGLINLEGRGKSTTHEGRLTIAEGDTLDFVVGWGNGTHICDSTGLEVRLEAPSGRMYDAAEEFRPERNPNGPWSYGHLRAGPAPDSGTFRPYDRPGRAGEQGTRLLNLGNPAARSWLTEHVDGLLTEQGIDLYRQDFNLDPLSYWRGNDPPDRQGITEIKHVTGYLAYWDELRRRHPDMLIDSCASGGRRNDLETLRRAVPLWRSDYAFEPVGHQCMTYGISLWIPYHGTGTVAQIKAPYYGGGLTPVEPYAFWSNVAPSLGSGIDVRVKEIDYDALRRLVGQWRKINPYYCGDFYPLTQYSRENNVWMAWQFHRPDIDQGMIQVFRRAESPDKSILLKLRSLRPEARYALTDLDVPGPRVMAGNELMRSGFPVSITERPGAAVFTYERAK